MWYLLQIFLIQFGQKVNILISVHFLATFYYDFCALRMATYIYYFFAILSIKLKQYERQTHHWQPLEMCFYEMTWSFQMNLSANYILLFVVSLCTQWLVSHSLACSLPFGKHTRMNKKELAFLQNFNPIEKLSRYSLYYLTLCYHLVPEMIVLPWFLFHRKEYCCCCCNCLFQERLRRQDAVKNEKILMRENAVFWSFDYHKVW